MSIRKGSSIIAGNIGQNVDSALSPTSDNPVKNSVLTEAFANTVSTKNITNCITEIPQDIKLELSGTTLTLKAGSKLYYPNGFEIDNTTPHFDTFITTSDLTLSVGGTGWTNAKHLIFINNDATSSYGVKTPEHCWSGSTTPTSFGQYAMWYDEINNIIRFTQDSGSTWTSSPFSLPICVALNTNTDCVGIHKIFNGFGYVGNLSYILPGVKGLAPNGRNEDGTLKNTQIIVSDVLLSSGTTRRNNDYLIFSTNYLSTIWEEDLCLDYYPTVSSTEWALVYDTNRNEYYRTSYGEPYTKVTNVNSYIKIWRNNTTGKIEDINKEGYPSKVLDYHNTDYISHQAMPSNRYIDFTMGATGTLYTAPADGFIYIRRFASTANKYVAIIKYLEGNIAYEASVMWSISAGDQYVNAQVSKGEKFAVTYNSEGGGGSEFFRFIYANGSI